MQNEKHKCPLVVDNDSGYSAQFAPQGAQSGSVLKHPAHILSKQRFPQPKFVAIDVNTASVLLQSASSPADSPVIIIIMSATVVRSCKPVGSPKGVVVPH